jgi:DNA (cytosine-5)-methyltransferase 1
MHIRKLTPTECERLQGFPDRWTEGVSDTQRYKTLGNAVTVNVVEAIAKKLLTRHAEK